MKIFLNLCLIIYTHNGLIFVLNLESLSVKTSIVIKSTKYIHIQADISTYLLKKKHAMLP